MDAFHTLAEIAVAIAGFSSLVSVFRGRMSDWQGQEYVSLAFAMCWSIGSAFFSLFPVVAIEFGFDLAASSRAGLFSLAAYMLVVGTMLTLIRRRVALQGGGRADFNVALTLLFALIVLGALLAAFGWIPGPMHAWFILAITLLMAHATAELGLLVIGVVRKPDQD